MQKDSKFFEDLSKLASGAAGGFMEMKREFDDRIALQLEKLLRKMSLATKEEVDTMRAMLAKERAEQEALKARIEALEAKLPK